MSILTLNGESIVSCSVTFPLYGAWSADVILAAAAPIDAAAKLVLANRTLVGTVVRTGSFAGSRTARIVGGGGGWRKELPPKGYSHVAGVKLSSVLADAARESGERINVASDSTIGTLYVREAAKAEESLRLLLGGRWYIDDTGVTQTTPRDGSTIATPLTVVSWKAANGQFEIATEDLASWTPGRKFSAPTVPDVQTISSVTIEAHNDGKLRLTVLNQDGAAERLRSDFASLVRASSPGLAYAGVWEYTIASGTPTTIDATPTDPKSPLPPITSCPMTPGLLGEEVTPTPGAKCRIVFVNGNPARPECIGIVDKPLSLTIDATLPAGVRLGAGVRPAIGAGDLAGGIWPCAPTQAKVMI